MTIYIVDAFAACPLTGNPAGVCPLDNEADGSWMQEVAREMNLSETAFIWPEEDGFQLRWLKTFPIRGVIVTAPSHDPKFDFVSRLFAPGADE